MKKFLLFMIIVFVFQSISLAVADDVKQNSRGISLGNTIGTGSTEKSVTNTGNAESGSGQASNKSVGLGSTIGGTNKSE